MRPMQVARAVSKALLNHVDTSACDRFSPDLNSACVCASTLLAMALRHHGTFCWLVSGRWRDRLIHWWVSTREELFDLTRRQLGFKNHLARLSLFHRDYETADARRVYLNEHNATLMQLPDVRKHSSHPCHRHAFMVEALASVTGISRDQAAYQMTAFIGPPASSAENIAMMKAHAPSTVQEMMQR